MKLPPTRFPASLSGQWLGSNPFDDKHHNADPQRTFTPLGALLECYAWWTVHKAEIGPAFAPMAETIRQTLKRADPKALAELEARQ